MSIQSNFPAIKPTLLLDFANTKALDPRITFTRASTATYYGTQTAKAEENLLLQSQDITTTWLNSNSTDTGNTSVAPDGSTTADTLTDNNTSGSHIVRQNIANSINTTYVVSCFLKAGTSNYACLGFYDPAVVQRYFSADFNLSAGTVRASAAGTSGTLTSSSITSVGSGWYRCVIVGQVSAGTSQSIMIGVSDGTTAFNTFGTIAYVGANSTIEVWGAQLEQRSAVTAYTVTTTQTITNYIPVLQTAASGVARFDHNPTTFESLGLLIEEQRTNLFTYSEQFDNAAWAKSNATITANTVVAPDGTLTGDQLVASSSSSTHFVYQNPTMTDNTVYTHSVYAKAREASYLAVVITDKSNAPYGRIFNLADGTSTSPAGVLNAPASHGSQSIGNGWYRCWVSNSVGTGATQNNPRLYTSNGTAISYTGDGYSGLYIWGAQLEAGTFPTSYIQTVASQVTRAADAASMTGTNFSSWYNQAEGAMYAEVVSAPVANIAQQAWYISDSTSSNIMALRRNTGGLVAFAVNAGGVGQADVSGGSVSAGASYKFAAVYKVNDFAVSLNAGSVTTDTSGSVPVVNQLNIGVTAAGAQYLNGTIKKIAYYPLRVTNAQLQGLTS